MSQALKVLHALFPSLGFGRELRAADQCQGNDLWLKGPEEQTVNADMLQFSVCNLKLFVPASNHSLSQRKAPHLPAALVWCPGEC